ncbi:MAG: acetylornithine deacetylase [Arenicellales bacterium]
MLKHTLKILEELISFDTTSCYSNLALMEAIGARLDALNIPFELSFNADKTKANLFASIGDASVAGIVLSGHTDVVPVVGQPWSTDPFTLVERDGKLFGRGTCDMKGFIAVCLAMAESIQQAGLDIPIHFAFSYDEEVGCIGVRDVIAELNTRDVKPLACIVGEPTNMKIVSAHKGMLDKTCHVTGCAGHSSLPNQGVNAIYAASKLINQLQEMGDEIKQNGPFDARFEPPYTTVHVGNIQGGTVVNIIPQQCEFEYEIRNIPAQDPQLIADELERFAEESLLPDMQAISDKSDIQWSVHSAFPALDTPYEAAINPWMKKILNQGDDLSAVSYGTEAGLFSEIGIETIVCGPGSIEQAHRPDEYVEISEIQACIVFMESMLSSLKKNDLPI